MVYLSPDPQQGQGSSAIATMKYDPGILREFDHAGNSSRIAEVADKLAIFVAVSHNQPPKILYKPPLLLRQTTAEGRK